MKVTIWHNPKCATSRKVLDLIRAQGHSVEVVDYVQSPPSTADIRAVLAEAGLKARDLLRQRGTPYEELGLDDTGLSEAALVKAMHEHPILIERPVVRTPKGTRLCRPPDRALEVLG
jgi:arsenate reductase (glutaredoxin)